jgi:hypothetical protein
MNKATASAEEHRTTTLTNPHKSLLTDLNSKPELTFKSFKLNSKPELFELKSVILGASAK